MIQINENLYINKNLITSIKVTKFTISIFLTSGEVYGITSNSKYFENVIELLGSDK